MYPVGQTLRACRMRAKHQHTIYTWVDYGGQLFLVLHSSLPGFFPFFLLEFIVLWDLRPRIV